MLEKHQWLIIVDYFSRESEEIQFYELMKAPGR